MDADKAEHLRDCRNIKDNKIREKIVKLKSNKRKDMAYNNTFNKESKGKKGAEAGESMPGNALFLEKVEY